MIVPAPGDVAAVRIVEVEVAFELGRRRLARIATVRRCCSAVRKSTGILAPFVVAGLLALADPLDGPLQVET